MGFNPVKVIEDVLDPFGAVHDGGYGTDLVSSGMNLWDDFTGKSGIDAANRTNLEIARQQMAFQERMSSTAHQREVSDLRAVGLNPILSSGGSGASTPAGSAPRMESTKSGIQGGVMSLLSFVLSAMKTKADVDVAATTAGKNLADTDVQNKTLDLLSQKILGESASAKSMQLQLPEKKFRERLATGLNRTFDITDSIFQKLLEKVVPTADSPLLKWRPENDPSMRFDKNYHRWRPK